MRLGVLVVLEVSIRNIWVGVQRCLSCVYIRISLQRAAGGDILGFFRTRLFTLSLRVFSRVIFGFIHVGMVSYQRHE